MNEDMFEKKYNSYKHMVFNISYSYLNNYFDAEDAVEDTFIKFYNKNMKFNTAADEKYYLIRMTINVCKDILKEKKKYVFLNNEDLDYLNQQKRYDVHNKYTILDDISKLKSNYKEIIIYRYLENLSHKEIAKILKISESSSQKRLERAIKELKKLGGKDYE